jgi:hypothetical protein
VRMILIRGKSVDGAFVCSLSYPYMNVLKMAINARFERPSLINTMTGESCDISRDWTTSCENEWIE